MRPVSASRRARDLVDSARAASASRRAAERERWPRERLAHHQRRQLDALVRHAVAGAPFWRERIGRTPTAVELRELPVLDKATMMASFDDLVTDTRLRRDELLAHLDGLDGDALHLGEHRVMTTSGSSGLKGLFVYDREAWVALLAQFFRYSAWAGNTPRLPRRRIAAIGGAGPTHMTRRVASTIDVGLHRVLSLPVTAPIPEMVERLNAFGPDWMNVFPSVASVLAGEQEAGRLRVRLRGMSTSSELRPPGLADRLQAAFGVRPMDLYATTEGLWGCECEHRVGVHLFEDQVIVENVDHGGDPVPAGEPGARLLLTNLFNRVQPLIRFEVSDAMTLEPEPCPCGRTLVRVRSLDGRAEDVLQIGGTTILPLHFAVVTADAEVRQFQVLQEGDSLRVRVVLAEAADPDAARRRLHDRVTARLREAGVAAPNVVVEPCAEIERGPGGKLQLVVADSSRRPAARRC